jgi:hypothetical protein
MGMFDTYLTTIACPIDDQPVADWQGKDGPCLLYTWKFGESSPAEADEPYDPADDEPITLGGQTFPSMRRPWLDGSKEARLPPVFELHASCGDHWLEAQGETDPISDAWTKVRLLLVTSSALLPGEFWPPFKAGEEPVAKFDSLRLYREGAGVYPEAMARRVTERERLRALLPAHGGDATCSRCSWMKDHAEIPAVGYAGAYLCEEHLPGYGYAPDQVLR